MVGPAFGAHWSTTGTGAASSSAICVVKVKKTKRKKKIVKQESQGNNKPEDCTSTK